MSYKFLFPELPHLLHSHARQLGCEFQRVGRPMGEDAGQIQGAYVNAL